MAKQTINIGVAANDGSGDPLRTAFDKINDNFTEVYDDITAIEGNAESNIMKVCKAEILYSNTSETTIITLPANAVIWNIGLNVVTAFNDSGTDLIDIGTDLDSQFFVTDQTVNEGSAVFFMTGSDVYPLGSITNMPYQLASSADITFTYKGQNSDATQGQAFVYIHYSLH